MPGPTLSPSQLDEILALAEFPKTYRTPSLRRGPAALRDDLIRILWKENAQGRQVLTRGSEALENYNSALTGPGGRGAVKTRPQALALQNDDRLRDEELITYALKTIISVAERRPGKEALDELLAAVRITGCKTGSMGSPIPGGRAGCRSCGGTLAL